MQLRIAHETIYAYERPLDLAAQALRLFARSHAGMDVLSWSVRHGRATLTPHTDGLGNLVAMAPLSTGAREVWILVQGEVSTRELGGRFVAPEPLPPLYYLRETALTAPDAAIAALLTEAPISAESLRAAAVAVRERLEFRSGATNAATTAAEALAHGAGVCQDHAHVLIAALRAHDVPARYVSGYIWTPADAEIATHAWVEAFVAGSWIGVDPANRCFAGEAHVRLAAGLDYLDAAPVTGVRAGGGAETMEVRVGVKAAAQQQQ